MYKYFVIFLASIHAVFAIDVIAAEALLLTCQSTGHTLYAQCVVKVPITPEDIAVCTSLKASYNLCLAQLTAPSPLIPAIDPDPYAMNPFTPCTYEAAHLILYDICPTTPAGM